MANKLGLSEKQLRSFYETVATGSVRAAALKLDVEPSVVSRQIQQLEAQLGVQLLERKGRSVRPTDAALRVMDHCKGVQASEELLLSHLAEMGGLQRGEVRIVAGEGFVPQLLSSVMQRFASAHPGVTLSIELANAAEAVRLVAQDQVHIGLALNPPPDQNTRVVALRPQPLRLVTWPGHPLSTATEPLALQEILRHPFGVMSQGFGLRQAVQLAAFSASCDLEPAFVSNSIALLRQYVLKHLGVTFLSASAVFEELAAGDVVLLRTDSLSLESTEARIIVRRGRPLSLSALKAIELLQEAGAFRPSANP